MAGWPEAVPGAPEAKMCGSSVASVQGFVPGEGFLQPGAFLPGMYYNRRSAVCGILEVPPGGGP